MLYSVEVPISPEPRRVIDEMNRMRTWLDNAEYQPIGFRQVGAGRFCRVEFADHAHASAFAEAFLGRVLGRSPS